MTLDLNIEKLEYFHYDINKDYINQLIQSDKINNSLLILWLP